MTTANARLQDEAIDHAVDVLRYERHVVLRMVAVLNRADARLGAALAEALLTMEADSFTVERLEALLASVSAINAEAYAQVYAELQPHMQGLSDAEVRWQVSTLRQSVPAAVQLQFPIAAVAPEQVYAAALSRPFQGRLLSGWIGKLAEDRGRMIREAVRVGYMDGLTAADIVRKIKGTKALNYADGLLDRSRRELMTVVNTALSHTAQTARAQTVAANLDLVKAVKWVSTLDLRTTKHICVPRDGKLYDPVTYKPIGHSIPWLSGPGRIHFNCRSVSVPVLRSWRELGIDADEMPPGTRASMDGAIPADVSYLDWLSRQSAARQDEVLGPVRGKLLRSGKLKMSDLYDNKGVFLTLAQLFARLGE